MKTSTSTGYVKRRVLELLREFGPMTRFEIGEELGIPKNTLGQCISTLNHESPRAEKRVHIVRWTRDVEGTRTYLRAVYAFGLGRDAKKPERMPGREANKRYRERVHAKFTSSSPFRMAASQSCAVTQWRQP